MFQKKRGKKRQYKLGYSVLIFLVGGDGDYFTLIGFNSMAYKPKNLINKQKV